MRKRGRKGGKRINEYRIQKRDVSDIGGICVMKLMGYKIHKRRVGHLVIFLVHICMTQFM